QIAQSINIDNYICGCFLSKITRNKLYHNLGMLIAFERPPQILLPYSQFPSPNCPIAKYERVYPCLTKLAQLPHQHQFLASIYTQYFQPLNLERSTRLCLYLPVLRM